MVGVYLSGTGNTKHCIERFAKLLDEKTETIPLENQSVVEKIKSSDTIILAYPIQYSNLPYMVRDFINSNSSVWKNKKVIIIVTMGLFSGDGAGCAARLLKSYGAVILGGLHLQMPDSVCDVKLLKKPIEKNKETVRKADKKIALTVKKIKQGIYPKDGLSFFSNLAGLFCQRLWFYNKTTGYMDKLKINQDCVGCGICVSACPMENIFLKDGKAYAGDKCTMCYRCISKCPKKAITLIGDKVYEQCSFEKYNYNNQIK